MGHIMAVIGVGNMAKAVISGIQNSDIDIVKFRLYDKNNEQYGSLVQGRVKYDICNSATDAVEGADCVLLSVKPQNYPELLEELASVKECSSKLYITIAAGISAKSVSDSLKKARTVRVLPNIPMVIGKGVSVICRNSAVKNDDFAFVCSLFKSAGSTVVIDEDEMNRIIGVTSSSPAYVFKFIDCIYKGAIAQGIDGDGLIDAICDVFIGSALLLKTASATPEQLIERVASKGGTTERALNELENANVESAIISAMIACTKRADELGNLK